MLSFIKLSFVKEKCEENSFGDTAKTRFSGVRRPKRNFLATGGSVIYSG